MATDTPQDDIQAQDKPAVVPPPKPVVPTAPPKQAHFFPELGISVDATTLIEAQKLAENKQDVSS